MVHEGQLSSVLSELASTLLTDFPIQSILNHLVVRILDVLPVSAVGITMISPGVAPLYVAASDDSALRFETLQTELKQGPCILAYTTGKAVAIPDLRHEERFPEFVASALPAGLAAAFTFPLRHGDGRVGALDLYRDTPGALSEKDMIAAQTLADVAAAYVLNAQSRDDARATSDSFQNSALHDPLTGLPNRLLLQQRLSHAAKRAERSHTYAAVLFADLDRFKHINDTYGHQVGDELLIAVARRLSELVRPGDTLARVSGDEFVFLCEDLEHASDVEILAVRINNALNVPFPLLSVTVTATASVGMAFAGPGEEITNQLIVDADIAMYQAKRDGGASHRIIDLREARQAKDHHTLEQDLNSAFAARSLDIAYQPIVRIGDGALIGLEALLRWNHPHRGPIAPMDMVAVAEANGLIAEIGAWVLEASCLARLRWLEERPGYPLDMSVNVSARQLMGPHFPTTVAGVLEKTSTDPAYVTLELTEGIFIRDAARAVSVLTDLKALGVRIALDDFGTGYSSLSYLRQFPVDIVKIDQTFVGSAILERDGATIVAAVTRLAHDLGLTVIAEGVETQQECDAIAQVGCDLAQGFYFAPALQPLELDSMFRANRDRLVSLAQPPVETPAPARPKLNRPKLAPINSRQASRSDSAGNGRCSSSTVR
jgi:diguanylate cyclase (GGDEF)-like protein